MISTAGSEIAAHKAGVVPTSDFLKKVMSTNPNSTPYALDLHGMNLRQLDALETFPKIRSLDVSFNKLTDLDGLKPLPDLRELKAYANRLVDVDSIGDSCPDLQLLHLHDNQILSLPKSFSKLLHLKDLMLHRNELSSISNLHNCASITFLDLSYNQLTAPMPGLSPLIALTTLLLNSNELTGSSLPHPIQDLHNLSEVQVSDNMLTGLSGVPRNVSVLMACRNHLSHPSLGLGSSPLPNLTELHLKGNRLISLPTNLGRIAPQLDLLDVSDNRLSSLECLVGDRNSPSPLGSLPNLRELYVAGNPCTPRDVNGFVAGPQAMEWWYAVAGVVCKHHAAAAGGEGGATNNYIEAEGKEGGEGGVEVLDDLLCGTPEVRKALASIRREKEVAERRMKGCRPEAKEEESKSAAAAAGKARPQSARKRPGLTQQQPVNVATAAAAAKQDDAVKKTDEAPGSGNTTPRGTALQYKMPVIKPPLAHSNRDIIPMKLEPMDDIEAKFGEIKSRLNKCKDLTRPNGVLPVGIELTRSAPNSTAEALNPEIEDDIAAYEAALKLEELEEMAETQGLDSKVGSSKSFSSSTAASPRAPLREDPSSNSLAPSGESSLDESPQSSQKTRQQKEKDDVAARAAAEAEKATSQLRSAARGSLAAAEEAARKKSVESSLRATARGTSAASSTQSASSSASRASSKTAAKLQQHLARVGNDEDSASAEPPQQRASSPRASDIEGGKKTLPSKSRTSSAIQNLLKKADQRIKQAQAYSGSKNSHLMPPVSDIPSGKSSSSSSSTTAGKRGGYSAPEPTPAPAAVVNYLANDAKEFHPEFEQYEGATLDDYDIGFGIYGQDGGSGKTPRESATDSKLLKFGLGDGGDDSSSSEDEAAFGKKIGIEPLSSSWSQASKSSAPAARSLLSAQPASVDDFGDDDFLPDEELLELDVGAAGDDDYVNPFTGERIKVSATKDFVAAAAPAGGIKSSLAFGKALLASETPISDDGGGDYDGGGSSSDSDYDQHPAPSFASAPKKAGVKPLALKQSSLSAAVAAGDDANGLPMMSPRFDVGAHVGAAQKKAPTKADRLGSFKGFRLPQNRNPEAKETGYQQHKP